AIKGGAAAVIAVGGDGTLHEVVNGFFEAGKPVRTQDEGATDATSLGLIPLGTGSDFARTFGWKNDPHEAIERIAQANVSTLTYFSDRQRRMEKSSESYRSMYRECTVLWWWNEDKSNCRSM
ncbi:hypothetical protein KI387_017553, partial [Taxus chinensis]